MLWFVLPYIRQVVGGGGQFRSGRLADVADLPDLAAL
jgi:hypothetical protein